MYYVAQSVVIGTAFIDSVIAALNSRAAAALVVSPKVRLSKNSGFSPQPGSSIASLAANEADFSGYPAGGAALTPTGPALLSGTCQGLIGTVSYEATTATPFVQDSVYGYWVDDGTNVLWAEAFGGGFIAQFGAVGSFLVLNLALPFQQRVGTS